MTFMAGNTESGLTQSRRPELQQSNAILLITRPAPKAHGFAQRVAGDLPAGAQTIVSPVLRIVPVDGRVDLNGVSGLVISASSALPFVPADAVGRQFSAYCVGRNTTQTARDAGLKAQFCGETAQDLINTILQDSPGGRLLHLRGTHARGDIANSLTNGGQPCGEAIVYDQIPQELSHVAHQALVGPHPVVVPVFSPRSAAVLGQQAIDARAPIVLVALSPAVAEAWSGPVPAETLCAARPDAASMQTAVKRAFIAAERLEGLPGPS